MFRIAWMARGHAMSVPSRYASVLRFGTESAVPVSRKFASKSTAQLVAKSSSSPSLLYLNASSGPQSLTALTANKVIESFVGYTADSTINEVDLWDQQLLQFNLSHVASQMRRLSGATAESDDDKLLPVHAMATELMSADILLVATPVWNFSCPYVLKQYIDCVIQPGLTIRDSDNGIQSLGATGKPLVLVLSAGGVGRHPTRDHLVPYLTDIFGVVGFTDVRVVMMTNTASRSKDDVLVGSLAEAEYIGREVALQFGANAGSNTCLDGT